MVYVSHEVKHQSTCGTLPLPTRLFTPMPHPAIHIMPPFGKQMLVNTEFNGHARRHTKIPSQKPKAFEPTMDILHLPPFRLF